MKRPVQSRAVVEAWGKWQAEREKRIATAERALARWRELGDDSDAGDLFWIDVAMLVFSGDRDDDEDRTRAARRLARLLGIRGLNSARKATLNAQELAELVRAALFEVVHDGRPAQPAGLIVRRPKRGEGIVWIDWRDRVEVMKRLKGAVYERLTQDALGPAWRGRGKRELELDLPPAVARTVERDAAVAELVESEARAERERQLATLEAELARAPEQQRRVVEAMLAAAPGESQREVAARIGVPLKTFETHLARFKKKVRAAT